MMIQKRRVKEASLKLFPMIIRIHFNFFFRTASLPHFKLNC